MTFESDIAEDIGTVFDTDEAAETVTYNGADIAAFVKYGEDPEDYEGGQASRAELAVQTADVADPAYRDSVVIGSETWTVRRIKSGSSYVWILEITRDERPGLL